MFSVIYHIFRPQHCKHVELSGPNITFDADLREIKRISQLILGAWLYKEKGTSGKRMAGNVKWGRIVLGGLVAGVVINLSHFFLNALVQVEASVAVSDHTVLWILYGLAVGVGGVWIYAAIQPRFSAGLKTAIIAGVATWLMLGSISMPGLWDVLGIPDYPLETVLVHRVGSLVALCVATSLGAWLYKEDGVAVGEPITAL